MKGGTSRNWGALPHYCETQEALGSMAFPPQPCLVPGQTTKIGGSYRPSDKKAVLLWDLDYLFEKKQDVPGSKGQETMVTGTVVRCGVCCRMKSRLEQARAMAVSQPWV